MPYIHQLKTSTLSSSSQLNSSQVYCFTIPFLLVVQIKLLVGCSSLLLLYPGLFGLRFCLGKLGYPRAGVS